MKMDRAGFLKTLLALSGAGTTIAWISAVSRDNVIRSAVKRVYLEREMTAPFARDGYIVCTALDNSADPVVFRNKCTHLGCELDVYADGRIVCPCHGSEFSPDGEVLQGPARKNLERIPVSWDPDEERYFFGS